MAQTSSAEFMSSFTRHQRLMNGYIKETRKSNEGASDGDVLRDKHQFIREDSKDIESAATSWETRMAMKYYKRLHKEYALADLSRHKEGKIGLRWRTELEVVDGKGQFECGNITPHKKCTQRESLCSYEVNFKYKEEGQVKNELVKLRLCPNCAKKLPGAKKLAKRLKEKDTEDYSVYSKRHKKSKREKKESKTSDDGSDQPRESTVSVWAHDAPKAKTEEDEMDTYLDSLLF